MPSGKELLQDLIQNTIMVDIEMIEIWMIKRKQLGAVNFYFLI
jgi:hypothetical protein